MSDAAKNIFKATRIGIEFALLLYVLVSSISKFIFPIFDIKDPIYLVHYFNSKSELPACIPIGCLLFAGYVRIFLGIHFLDFDESATDKKIQFIEEIDKSNRIYREDAVLRPSLYFLSLMMVWSLTMGETCKYLFCIFTFLQILIMIRYQILYSKILYKMDPEKSKNKYISR